MNIFYASCPSANNLAMPESRIWDINLRNSLSKMGYVFVPSFEVGKQYSEIYKVFVEKNISELNILRERYSDLLLKDIKKVHEESRLDLFFSYYSSRHIFPEVIDQIKKMGILTVNFFCNNIHQFHLVSEIAPHFDYCLFPEKNALNKYIDIDARPMHIQMAANPNFYKPYPLEQIYDVSFVGQNYLNREEYLAYLFTNGIDIHTWGAGWDRASTLPASHLGGPLSDDELIKMFSRSRISLNISEVLIQDKSKDAGLITRHIRLRDFEAPMSGAFYITGYQEELKEYYEIGKEIVCYNTKQELLDQIRYYLKHPDEATAIRKAGHVRALKEHTWENRFDNFFNKIGIKR